MLTAPHSASRALPGRQAAARRGAARGFTLVELIVVLVLMGILAAVAGPRFASMSAFKGAAGVEATLSTLRAAHGTAVGRRATVFVVIDGPAGRISLCNDAACTSPLAPQGGESTWLQLDASLRFASGATYSIAADGRPSLASPLLVQVTLQDSSAAGSAVQVEAETGHVRKL